MGDIAVVNIVGTGKVDQEFDLHRLANDLGDKSRYEPEMYPGMYVRVDEDDPLTTVYRTGKFIVVGAKSEDELYATREKVINYLSDVVGRQLTIDEFAINNYVLSGNLDRELNLNALAIGLGLENTEYEPEQFAGLVYKPENSSCTLMLFRSGNVIIAGGTTKEEAEEAFEHMTAELDGLFAE